VKKLSRVLPGSCRVLILFNRTTIKKQGATPMAGKLRPSQQMRKEIASIIQSKSEELLMDFFRKSSKLVLQDSLEEEITDFLQRDRHQHSEDPRGYRNGYYDRKIKSSEGAPHQC